MVGIPRGDHLVHSLAPHDARTEDKERALIRELLVSSADTISDRSTKCLRDRVHSLANPRSIEALTTLCETLNALQLPCPATDLRLVYEAPAVAWTAAPMSGVLNLDSSCEGRGPGVGDRHWGTCFQWFRPANWPLRGELRQAK